MCAGPSPRNAELIGASTALCQSDIKKVLAWQIEQAMGEQGLTKSAMARRMKTSRQALDRLLDPENDGVTLNTLVKAARAVGRRISLELV